MCSNMAYHGADIQNTHLHDDVEGKVKQQVADGDGQQVGGEVVGSLYEPIGGAADRKRPL